MSLLTLTMTFDQAFQAVTQADPEAELVVQTLCALSPAIYKLDVHNAMLQVLLELDREHVYGKNITRLAQICDGNPLGMMAMLHATSSRLIPEGSLAVAIDLGLPVDYEYTLRLLKLKEPHFAASSPLPAREPVGWRNRLYMDRDPEVAEILETILEDGQRIDPKPGKVSGTYLTNFLLHAFKIEGDRLKTFLHACGGTVPHMMAAFRAHEGRLVSEEDLNNAADGKLVLDGERYLAYARSVIPGFAPDLQDPPNGRDLSGPGIPPPAGP